MTEDRYPVTEVIIETPGYGGHGSMTGVVPRGTSGEHDILGHGWAEIQDNSITVSVHPRGIVGRLGPSEKRTYPLTEITSWGVAGASITFGVGKMGLIATNGAEAPIHNCQMKCEDAVAAQQLTEEARTAGLRTGSSQSFHSGI
jgi:hypothetical protein